MLRYSVAISPPDTVIEAVREMKQRLRGAIGWYNSVNALAHTTFNVFQAGSDALTVWEDYISRFAAQQKSVLLRFSHTGNFSNGAFFLAPDENSERLLVDMMQAFHRKAPLDAHQSMVPHISIARLLTLDQLAIARTLIPEADVYFKCSDLVLRRFNEFRRQYDIYRRFSFDDSAV